MRVAFILLSVLFMASCDSSNGGTGAPEEKIAAFRISGRQEFSGGARLKTGKISYRLSVEGDNLFRHQGGACRGMPERGAGLYLGTATPTQDGSYALEFSTQSIRASVVPSCLLSSLKSHQILGLKLAATLPADADNCETFCAGTQPDHPSCAGECATGKRLLQAVHSIPKAELSELIGSVRGGVLDWKQDLKFTRLGPALAEGGGVDLQINAASAVLSAHVSREMYKPDSCETNASCIRGPGLRTLLRFDAVIENVGSTDLILGNPAGNPLFQRHACHDHYHLQGVLNYELVYPSSGEVVTIGGSTVIGEKTSFCMMDMDRVIDGASSQGYECDNQGISSGWSDTYESSLECQFIDVTGVPPGAYLLRMTVDPDGILDESNTSNNVTEIPVTIT